MKPLYVLIGTFLVTAVILRFVNKSSDLQLAGRIAMACMLIFTAIGHFAFTKGMAAMIPGFMPFKPAIVIATGVLELLFAVGLLFPAYRSVTGWLLIAFFILVLPSNIKASMEHINYQTGELNGPGLSYLWLRIPAQIFFIVWVYLSSVKN